MRFENFFGTLFRYFIAVVLITGGVGKFLDISGFATVLNTYQLLPEWANMIVAYLMPVIELTIGAGLVSGFRMKEFALAAVVLHFFFLSLVIVTLSRGLQLDNCGCFGVFWARPLTYWTVGEDLIMLIMAVVVLKISLKGKKRRVRIDAKF